MAARKQSRNPHGSKPKGWFKRCVAGVKRSGSAVDPNAVCGAIEARGNPSDAYRAGQAGLRAAAARYGTTNLSPSIAQREEWGHAWAQFMAGWNSEKKKKNPVVPLALAETVGGNILQPYGKQAAKEATKFRKRIGLKLNKRKNPRNPAGSASNVYEGFHGKPSEQWVEITTPIHEHKFLAALGELISLDIITATGGRVTVKGFEFAGNPALLCSNERRNQMFIEGGDQTVNLKTFGIREPVHEKEVLGELNSIEYYTIKKHLGDEGGEAIYRHKLKSHRFRRKPQVIYDTVNGLLSFAGGNYEVLDEGITD